MQSDSKVLNMSLQIGFTSEGKITVRDVRYYCNGGNTVDVSMQVSF